MYVFLCPSDLGSYFPTNLTDASSIAIWNKNRLVVGIAIIVWVTNVLVILGKSALMLSTFRNPILMRPVSGVVRVNNLQSQQFRAVQAYPSTDALRMGPCSARLYRAQH